MDPIQRKLDLIDKQLAGGEGFHKRIITTAPLVFAAVGLMLGILLQQGLAGPADKGDALRFPLGWAALLGACSLTGAVLFATDSRYSRPQVIAYAAFVCFMCLGAIRVVSFNRPASNDIRRLVGGDPKLAQVRGLIVTEPYVQKREEWAFARFKPTDPTSSFYLKLTEAKAVDGWAKARGTIRVQIDTPILDLKPGDYIETYCVLSRFAPATNPGQFDIARHLAGRGIFISASIESRDGIELLASPPAALFTRLKIKVRQVAAEAVLGSVPSDEPGRGLVEALLLGYRGDIDSDTYKAFKRTGLLHYVSLSGAHFAVLIGIVWWMGKTLGLAKRSSAVLCTVAIAVFLLVVPAQAPSTRAGIIAWVFCASVLLRRHANPFNTLSLAAIILLLIRPSQLFAVDWQLSFACVLGILLFTDGIRRRLDDAADGLAGELDYRQFWRAAKVVRKLAAMVVMPLSVGFGAWLGGAGIMLYQFYTITPMASIWTLLVLPLMGAILTLGFIKIILFFLLPTLSAALGVVVTGLSDVFIRAVKLFADLDFTGIMIGHVPVWLVVFFYVFILLAFFARFRRPSIKKAVCTVMALLLAVFIGGIKWQRIHRGELILTCLDVSHGQAIFAQLPGGGNILFDAGSLNISDVGRRIVAPFLDYKGIGKIDTLFISHNDIDHINGIPEVVQYCKVGRICANEAFFEDVGQWGAAKFLGDLLKALGLEIERVTPGSNFGGGAAIENIWPSGQSDGAGTFSENDKSHVLLIEFAGRKILLCSDIEKAAQKEILRLNPELRADIVIAPHHGSRRTADPDFLKTLAPEILIYSCGQREYESRREIKQDNSANHLYTPYHGAITVRIDKNGAVRIETAAHQD
jgi:competence protein ComEC